MHAHYRRHAFTLIELLVVIGIIAILIALLLPMLGRIRQHANNTRCLANLHQMGVYLQQYQTQFKGLLPIYITPAYADKTIYHANVNDYTGLGLLVPAGIAPPSGSEQGRIFYCPSVSVGSQRTFNHLDPSNPLASNPWVGVRGYSTRISYSLRVEYWSWDGSNGSWWNIQYPNTRFDMNRTSAAADAFIVPTSNRRPVFPSANEFSHKSASAIICDLNTIKINPAVAHRGWNVLCANWSAKFVPQDRFKNQFERVWALTAQYPNGAPVVRRAWFDLWHALDDG